MQGKRQRRAPAERQGAERRRARPAARRNPPRTCIGCRATRRQSELVRVVRTPAGELAVGRTLPGRGAWLCAATAPECAEQAARRRAFGRALRADITPDAVQSLRTLLANRASMEGR